MHELDQRSLTATRNGSADSERLGSTNEDVQFELLNNQRQSDSCCLVVGTLHFIRRLALKFSRLLERNAEMTVIRIGVTGDANRNRCNEELGHLGGGPWGTDRDQLETPGHALPSLLFHQRSSSYASSWRVLQKRHIASSTRDLNCSPVSTSAARPQTAGL